MAWNWKLTTSGGQAEFGDDNASVVVQDWSVTPGKLRVDDQENPRRDGLRFGRDYRSGQVAQFSMWISEDTEAAAMPKLNEFSALWRNDGSRLRGGTMATLHHPRGRHAYGRPRGFTADAQRVERGTVLIEADFECVDDLWYGPESETTIRLIPPTGGGLTFPAEAPFTFDSGPTERNGSVLITGDLAVSPVFEIAGPITNPEIDVVGVGRLRFSTELAYDQTLTVDTRHWAQWVKRDGAALPGVLMPSSAWLTDISLSPGAYTVMLRGYDPTGTATLTVRTAPVFTSF